MVSMASVIRNTVVIAVVLQLGQASQPLVSSHGRDELVTLTPDNGGSWGSWGSIDLCPKGSFVSAFELKVEPWQGYSQTDALNFTPRWQQHNDDSALNVIKLHCRDRLQDIDVGYVTSSQQVWGTWRGRLKCRDGFITGFRLRVEKPQGHKDDDTAATDLDMICENGEVLQGKGAGWGDWGRWQHCPEKQAICGLRTLVEEKQGKGDDTALNSVKMYCCYKPTESPMQP